MQLRWQRNPAIVYRVHEGRRYRQASASGTDRCTSRAEESPMHRNPMAASLVDGFHADRAARRHRHHRRAGRPALARGPVRPRGRQPGEVPEQPQAARPGRPGVSRLVQHLPRPAGTAWSPTYDANGTLIGGDVNCATPVDALPALHVGRLPSLFIKLEQVNLYNEINFNLPPNNVENTTAVRRTIDALSAPRTGGRRRPPQTGSVQRLGPFGLPGQHGGGHDTSRRERPLPDPGSRPTPTASTTTTA